MQEILSSPADLVMDLASAPHCGQATFLEQAEAKTRTEAEAIRQASNLITLAD